VGPNSDLDLLVVTATPGSAQHGSVAIAACAL